MFELNLQNLTINTFLIQEMTKNGPLIATGGQLQKQCISPNFLSEKLSVTCVTTAGETLHFDVPEMFAGQIASITQDVCKSGSTISSLYISVGVFALLSTIAHVFSFYFIRNRFRRSFFFSISTSFGLVIIFFVLSISALALQASVNFSNSLLQSHALNWILYLLFSLCCFATGCFTFYKSFCFSSQKDENILETITEGGFYSSALTKNTPKNQMSKPLVNHKATDSSHLNVSNYTASNYPANHFNYNSAFRPSLSSVNDDDARQLLQPSSASTSMVSLTVSLPALPFTSMNGEGKAYQQSNVNCPQHTPTSAAEAAADHNLLTSFNMKTPQHDASPTSASAHLNTIEVVPQVDSNLTLNSSPSPRQQQTLAKGEEDLSRKVLSYPPSSTTDATSSAQKQEMSIPPQSSTTNTPPPPAPPSPVPSPTASPSAPNNAKTTKNENNQTRAVDAPAVVVVDSPPSSPHSLPVAPPHPIRKTPPSTRAGEIPGSTTLGTTLCTFVDPEEASYPGQLKSNFGPTISAIPGMRNSEYDRLLMKRRGEIVNDVDENDENPSSFLQKS
eukprot:GDKK01017820.1.p1 GENE.GDKK01017820.1~~GDKK01017820.1.p1  ORF type:complete len:620 (+),score=139.82 GDKK01017820.1:183-1862(+)